MLYWHNPWKFCRLSPFSCVDTGCMPLSPFPISWQKGPAQKSCQSEGCCAHNPGGWELTAADNITCGQQQDYQTERTGNHGKGSWPPSPAQSQPGKHGGQKADDRTQIPDRIVRDDPLCEKSGGYHQKNDRRNKPAQNTVSPAFCIQIIRPCMIRQQKNTPV